MVVNGNLKDLKRGVKYGRGKRCGPTTLGSLEILFAVYKSFIGRKVVTYNK